jgi:hypothetical protein
MLVWICIWIGAAVNARSHDGHVTVARNLIRHSRRRAHHVQLVMSHDRRSRSRACSRVLNHRRHRRTRHRRTRHRITGKDVTSCQHCCQRRHQHVDAGLVAAS